MALTRQCALAGVARSTVYAPRLAAVPNDLELLLLTLIDAEYTRHPFYGSRRMVVHLGKAGHLVNRKRVQRLMGFLGLAGMAPGPRTSQPHPQHKIYPYLLRGVNVTRPNQVWSTDITYGAPRLGISRGAYSWNARRKEGMNLPALRCGRA
jgi:putative transposase